MFKTVAATGLALSLGFAGLIGVGTASAEKDTGASVDLQTKIEAAVEDGDIVTKTDLQSWADTYNWDMEDLQVWAQANAMTETEVQNWAEENGWSEEDSAKLDLDISGSIQLDNILDDNDEDYGDEEYDEDDGLLGGLLGGLF